jgi:hypothetical protein
VWGCNWASFCLLARERLAPVMFKTQSIFYLPHGWGDRWMTRGRTGQTDGKDDHCKPTKPSILYIETSGYPWPSDIMKSPGFFKPYLFILNRERASPGQDGSGGRMGPLKGPPLPLRSLV